MEKKTAQLACKTTDDVKRGLIGLAALHDLSLSEYQEKLFIEHIEAKKTEARLLNQALGIKEN